METYEEQILAGFEDESLCSAQESRASQAALPGSEEAARMTVGSGRQLLMLSNRSSRLGLFSRILLESSLWVNSQEFCYVWKKRDTKLGYSKFQLTPLGQSTEDSGSSLWRTPNAAMVSGGGMDGQERLEQGHAMQLSDQVMTPKLWPTPLASEPNATGKPDSLLKTAKLWPTPTVPNGGRRNPEGTSITGRKPDGDKAQIDIREFAIRMLPTPKARDFKSGSGIAGQKRHSPALSEIFQGSLNPRFVEQLMGFPTGHTDLKPLETPSSRSRLTRSSRRLPKLRGGV